MRRIERLDGWLALALVAAGCGGGGTAPERADGGTVDAGGGTPTGAPTGTAPGMPTGTPTSPPATGAPPACSVGAEAALGTGEAGAPSIAFGGGRFAAAWTEGGALRAAVVDDRGVPSANHALPAGSGAKEPAIAAIQGGGYVVVWKEPGTVRGIRLGADAAPSGGPFTLGETAGGDPKPAIAEAGRSVAVAWADAAGVTAGELAGNAISGKTAVPEGADPALAAGKDSTVLVFTSGSKMGMQKLGSSEKPVIFHDASKPNVPRAGAADGGTFVTWEDDALGEGHESVFLTRLAENGRPGAEVVVPDDGGSANYPDIAVVGGYAAVVYYQYREGPSKIYLSIFGRDLQRAGADLAISGKHARFPRVASSGDGRLGVAYAEAGGPARIALLSCH